MIRKLISSDYETLLEYLEREEALNSYILSNLKVYGLEDENITIFGEFDEKNQYLAVLLFTKHQSIFFAQNRLFNPDWLTIFEQNDFSNIGGVKSIIDKIQPYFKDYIISPSYVAEATKLREKYVKPDIKIIKVTTEDQCEKLFDLLSTIEEFSHRTKNKQDFIETRMKAMKISSTYYIEENGKMISTATASGETKNNAVVVMVGTALEGRYKGLASILVKHIMHEYIDVKKKSLCLFYDNPKAGNIYKRLGFKDVEQWIVLFEK
ncbi:MAG: GNAT family N-acetyltransferase [Firmicutes bacterium]|nr:GNAT family N-acetyltransferase [Bacillota bacterium]